MREILVIATATPCRGGLLMVQIQSGAYISNMIFEKGEQLLVKFRTK